MACGRRVMTRSRRSALADPTRQNRQPCGASARRSQVMRHGAHSRAGPFAGAASSAREARGRAPCAVVRKSSSRNAPPAMRPAPSEPPSSRMRRPGARASSRAWRPWCTRLWPARARWRPRAVANSMTRKLPAAWSIWPMQPVATSPSPSPQPVAPLQAMRPLHRLQHPLLLLLRQLLGRLLLLGRQGGPRGGGELRRSGSSWRTRTRRSRPRRRTSAVATRRLPRRRPDGQPRGDAGSRPDLPSSTCGCPAGAVRRDCLPGGW